MDYNIEAIQVAGDAQFAFQIAYDNNLSITDEIYPGQKLQYSIIVANKFVVENFANLGFSPANKLIDLQLVITKIFDITFDNTFQ